METENTQFMQEQYHILRINRSIERLEKLGSSHRYPKGYIFDYREHSPDSIYYIKKGRIMAYEDTFNGEHRVYNIVLNGFLFVEE